jgi:hypothetical protein
MISKSGRYKFPHNWILEVVPSVYYCLQCRHVSFITGWNICAHMLENCLSFSRIYCSPGGFCFLVVTKLTVHLEKTNPTNCFGPVFSFKRNFCLICLSKIMSYFGFFFFFNSYCYGLLSFKFSFIQNFKYLLMLDLKQKAAFQKCSLKCRGGI